MRTDLASALLGLAILTGTTGCGGAVIEPGHRGLRFDPRLGGLQHEMLQPGYHALHCGLFTSVCPRIDDFSIMYASHDEHVAVVTVDGFPVELHMKVVARPIIIELYQLDTEIGADYYRTMIAPEALSAAREVVADESGEALAAHPRDAEIKIEAALRRRTAGMHVEISSVTLRPAFAPEVERAIGEQVRAEAREKATRSAPLMASLSHVRQPDGTRLSLDVEPEREGRLRVKARLVSADGAAAGPSTEVSCDAAGSTGVDVCAVRVEQDLARWLDEQRAKATPVSPAAGAAAP